MKLNAASIAGVGLWSLALYLGFSPLSEAVMEQIDRLLKSIASRISPEPQRLFELTALLASLLSVIPFLIVGGLCNFGVEASLGGSWPISTGILACIGGGVYELGRRDGQAAKGR
ncbi:hypothetical protein H6F67_18000 [Microcoleus sp. FACHB-1515]|nr:hypothetical protein [Microcoleus sp. FACHB-1515]